jgi:hypothetical protein
MSFILALAASPPAGAADTLLSQGKTATASSAENAVFSAAAAVDGDPGTRWSSGFSDPQWIRVDLGQTATISQVTLSWEAAYAKAFQIQVSADGTNWNSIYTTTTSAFDLLFEKNLREHLDQSIVVARSIATAGKEPAVKKLAASIQTSRAAQLKQLAAL